MSTRLPQMNLLYDISVLGVGHFQPLAKTGIYRTVEELGKGFGRLCAGNVTFCATGSIAYYQYATAYLAHHHADFADISLAHVPLSHALRSRLEKHRIDIKKAIKLSPNSQVLTERARRSYYTWLKQFNHYFDRFLSSRNTIVPEQIQRADIFHSPYYPFPQQVRDATHLKKFLTVYDLILLHSPQFFNIKKEHFLKRVLADIDDRTWVLCISHATKHDLCNYLPSLDPSRIFVTHLAASDKFHVCVDSDRISAVKTKYQLPNAPYFLSVATLEPRKNIEHVLRCFGRLLEQREIPDAMLVLVGTKGWDYDRIFHEISQSKLLQKRCICTGYVADDDLAPLYSGALGFVYPSFYEGFGLPPLEAMQCGVPVITSNTSSLPEVVGDAGIMLAPTDEDALCQAMLDIYRQTSLRESMSQKSLERAEQFSWNTCVQETIAAYHTALNR